MGGRWLGERVTYREETRKRLRAGAAALTVAGALSVVLGFAAPRLGVTDHPVPVPTGARVAVPDPPPFGGKVALYGRPTTDTLPTREQLGCRLEDRDGDPLEASALSAAAATSLDRRVVAGDAVLPLLVVKRGGTVLLCAGPLAQASEPLYLLTVAGVGDMVPMAAFSLAALFLVLGIGGVFALRPQE